MMNDKVTIDPWGSSQSTDYSRIIEKFGLSPMSNVNLSDPSRLHRRDIVFAHRELDVVMEAKRKGDPFGVLTGLMPSGMMHLGHSMVIDQVNWFQEQGGDVTIAVADLESTATRGISLAEGRKIATEEYVANYAALGLDPEKTPSIALIPIGWPKGRFGRPTRRCIDTCFFENVVPAQSKD